MIKKKFCGHVGPLHKIKGYLITMETYVQQWETIWKPVFHTWAKMLKQMYILGYLGGLEGVFNDQTGPILLPAILSSISIYMTNKETIW